MGSRLPFRTPSCITILSSLQVSRLFLKPARKLGRFSMLLTTSSHKAAKQTPAPRLTEEQKSQYEEDGYLVVKDVFDASKVKLLSDAMDQFVQRSATMSESDANFTIEWNKKLSRPVLKRVALTSMIHPLFREIHYNDKLVDIVCELIGPSVRYMQNDAAFLNLPVDSGSPIQWHQDWAFWPHTNQSLVTVFLSIDDSLRETGCLQVIPGSHKGPLYCHHHEGKFASAINDETFDPSPAVHLEVPAGGISLHHVRTVHGSAANQSNQSRRYHAMIYGAMDAWPLLGVVGKEGENWGPVDWDRFCSTIVRGSATQFPRMENLPVLLPAPFISGDRFFSGFRMSIHGDPNE